ncbi:MFS transporter [Zavarzinia aquatilis]|uniref:MFS transporter n=2 Tax=Zavarzinia aquatilis TaxID=2211142 RepID=A0A317EHC3_9PROT|nr:MFS transporter [Zavarzinia aquatilis]
MTKQRRGESGMSSVHRAAGAASRPVGVGTLFAFAAPALGLYAVGLPVAVYLPPFYANDLGLGLTVVGQIFMLCRLFDLAADLGLGAVSDRVRSRFGRRRSMLVLAVPLMGLGAWQMFMPPAGAGPLYVLCWLVVMYAGYALGVISHMSWGAELSPDYHQRSRIQGWREMAGIIGIVALLALPALIEQMRGGTKAEHIAAMGWFIIAIFPLGVLWCAIKVPDPSTATTGPSSHPGLRETVLTVARNRLVRRVLLADLLAGVPPAVTGALFIFMIEAVARTPGITSTLLLGYFVAGIVGIPAWMAISQRFGKHRAFALGALWNCVLALCFLLIEPGDSTTLTVITLLYGLGYASGTFLLKAIMADVADEDEMRSGHNRTGLFFGVLTMTNKVGFALAVGVTYPLLALFGFSPEAAASTPAGQPIAGTGALMAVFVFLPFAMNLAAAAIMARFPLDAARLAEVHRVLSARRAGE